MVQENYKLASIETLKSLLVTIAFVLWFYWLWSRCHLYRFALQVPGIFGLPLLGSIGVHIWSQKNLLGVLEGFFKKCKSCTVCIWLGIRPVLLTSDPDTIEKVLTSNDLLHKASFYRPMSNIFGGALIADPPEIWRHNRKVIVPSVSHKVLISFFPLFHKAKVTAVSKLDDLVGKGEHQIREMLRRLGFAVSLETTMGYVLKEGDNSDEDFVKNISNMLEGMMVSFALTFFHLDHLYRYYHPYDKAITNAAKFMTKVIENKLKSRADAKIHSNSNENPLEDQDSQGSPLMIKKSPTIFLDIAIDNYEKNQFDWDDMISESGSFLIGAFETSTSVVLGAIVMLAVHPEFQEQLFNEIHNFYPEKDFEMKHEDIKHLPYLTMVINETMRLMPPIPLFGRQVVKDFRLTTNLMLPRSLDVLIDVFHLHRRTDLWGPNADKFNPDNFLPENFQDKHSYAFMPFSKGPRMCLGYRYAYHSISVLLSGFVRNFRFTTSCKYEDLNFYDDIAIKFIEEPGIAVHRREI